MKRYAHYAMFLLAMPFLIVLLFSFTVVGTLLFIALYDYEGEVDGRILDAERKEYSPEGRYYD